MLVLPVRDLASRIPIAAEVRVSILLDEGDAEGPEGVNVVVERSVGVPGFGKSTPMRVDEDECGGEGIVVVNYEGEVGH